MRVKDEFKNSKPQRRLLVPAGVADAGGRQRRPLGVKTAAALYKDFIGCSKVGLNCKSCPFYPLGRIRR
jgi:hypothetical protein